MEATEDLTSLMSEDPDTPSSDAPSIDNNRHNNNSNNSNNAPEVVFTQSGVYVRSPSRASHAQHTLVPGTLSMELIPMRGLVVLWRPLTEGPRRTGGVSEGDGAEWAVVVQEPAASPPPTPDKKLWLDVELTEVGSMRITDDGNQVVLVLKDGASSQPLIFLGEGSDEFVKRVKLYRSVRKSTTDDNLYLVRDPKVEDIDRTLTELHLLDDDGAPRSSDAVWNFVAQIQRDPYTTALTAFSKLTDKLIYSQSQEFRPEDEVAELLQQSMIAPDEVITTTADGEYEVVTPQPGLLDELPEVQLRGDPLCQMDWELHFDGEGRMLDRKELMMKVFRGGVSDKIRPEVWKFLLGYYDPEMTYEEREKHRATKVSDYHRMKIQWTTITPAQEKNFSSFRERRTQIEKDVLRTDRSHPFFEGEDNVNLRTLNDILMTYVMFNFDLGYVQGMSDLLSPLLYVMGNEVDAFWCFVGFMERMKGNFDLDQGGMKFQLGQLVALERTLDPELFHYLKSNDSGNFYFAFRWLLIWFKREFCFSDILRLWEALWSGVMCVNFHLLLCLALLHNEKATIMENRFGLTEILKHVNDLAYRIDVDTVLGKAEAIQLKLTMAEAEERAKETEQASLEEEEEESEERLHSDIGSGRRIRKLMDILHGRDDTTSLSEVEGAANASSEASSSRARSTRGSVASNV